jgi:hypothetical protein
MAGRPAGFPSSIHPSEWGYEKANLVPHPTKEKGETKEIIPSWCVCSTGAVCVFATSFVWQRLPPPFARRKEARKDKKKIMRA